MKLTDFSDLYSQLEATIALNLGMQTGFFPPPLRDWALSPDALLHIMGLLQAQSPKLIVECGSGSSTVYIAQMYKSLGLEMPRYIALEHDAKYVEKTRQALTSRGLSDQVELIHAPLKPVTLMNGATTSWYDVSSIKLEPETIDFLLIDGPPAGTDPFTRVAFATVLGEHLSKTCTIFLDDYQRMTEVKGCEALEKMGTAHRVSELLDLEKGAAILAVGPVTDPDMVATFRASPTSLVPASGTLDETFKDGLAYWTVINGADADSDGKELEADEKTPHFNQSTNLRSNASFDHVEGQGYELTLEFDHAGQSFRGVQIGLELLNGEGEILTTIHSHSFKPEKDESPAVQPEEAESKTKAEESDTATTKDSGAKDSDENEKADTNESQNSDQRAEETQDSSKTDIDPSTIQRERAEISVAKIAKFESQGLTNVRPVIGIYAPEAISLLEMTINRVEPPPHDQ